MPSVQPVWDRYCIRCHGLGEKPSGNVALIGSKSYKVFEGTRKKTNRPWIKFIHRNRETAYSTPKDYYSHNSEIVPFLKNGAHNDVTLDEESWLRIIEWLDLNAPMYSDFLWDRPELRTRDKRGEKALRAYISTQFGETLANQPFEALVNSGLITESRILNAPLATSAGGWGQMPNGWKTIKEPGYVKMLKLVRASLRPLKKYEGVHPRSGSTWVKQAEEDYQEFLKRSH